MTEYYTIKEAAEELGVCRRTVVNYIDRGYLQSYRLQDGTSGSPHLITKEQINEYIKTRRGGKPIKTKTLKRSGGDFFTVKEVAEKLKLGVKSIYNLIRDGKLKSYRVMGDNGPHIITQEQIDACVKGCGDE